MPSSQLRSEGRLRKEVTDEWEEHVPALRACDRICSNLAKSRPADSIAGVWCSGRGCDGSKQGNNREESTPHGIQKVWRDGDGESDLYLTDMNALKYRTKRRCIWHVALILVARLELRPGGWIPDGLRSKDQTFLKAILLRDQESLPHPKSSSVNG